MFGLGLMELLAGGALLAVMVSVAIRVVNQLSGNAGGRRVAAHDHALALEERTARLEENLAPRA